MGANSGHLDLVPDPQRRLRRGIEVNRLRGCRRESAAGRQKQEETGRQLLEPDMTRAAYSAWERAGDPSPGPRVSRDVLQLAVDPTQRPGRRTHPDQLLGLPGQTFRIASGEQFKLARAACRRLSGLLP